MSAETAAHVLQAARLLFRPGDVVEVRVPKAARQRTISGYFDDFEQMAAAVEQLEFARYPGIYWTLNPLNPALLSRAENKVKPFAAATASDRDVLRRCLLGVDLDPKRPAEISSTDAEHEAALTLAERMQSELLLDGWPEALLADSGNGAHLVYLVDLPNAPESAELLKGVLQALAARFNTPPDSGPLVEVDLTTFNASRIFKIYGTTARKGDSTKDRPHRLSQILHVPALFTAVSGELLHILAAKAPAESKTAWPRQPQRSRFDSFSLPAFLMRYGIQHRDPVPYEGGRKFVLAHCPFDPSHADPDSCVFERPDGFGFKCLHNSCADKDWRAFREFYEPESARRRRPTRAAPAPPVETLVEPSAGDKPGQNIPPEPPAEEEAEEPPDLIDYPLTDSGNGERIVALFGKDIRYCLEMRHWLIWDGRHWAVDRANLMRQKAKEMARLLYYQASKLPEGAFRKAVDRHARASESSRGITNALTEAESISGVPVSAQELDQFPDRFNFLNGTLSLRDGSLQPHDRAMLLTKLCEHNFRPEAKAPKFQVFIEWAMGGPVDGNPDAELSEETMRLVSFLQRVIGYSITGDVSEKAVFVFYGADGDNGKTTLLTLFRELLGRDYASLLLIDTIMHARSTDNTAREDMADLRGARFVQTSEVSKEDRLNEQRIKFLTQGMGTIKSRRLHEHLVEFIASHKLLMDCNYRPKVAGQDNAIWRRLVQIPFTQTIPEAHKDLRLCEKLAAEAEGILAWAVRGAALWYEQGLGKPPEVTEAQKDWREHDDPLREFLEDWCELGKELFCPVADLMTAYLHWAREYGEKFPLPRRAFNESLVGKGIRQDRKRLPKDDERGSKEQARCWSGVQLKSSALQKIRSQDTFFN